MKAITAMSLMKKHGLIHNQMRLRDLKMFRRAFGHKTWPDFIKSQMFAFYLTKELKTPIIIPEVGFAVGGTMNMETGQLTGAEP
ncbi:MAG: hypothetical protein PHT77_10215 [Bacteroidales bacterium]|nr:hypothetical protein [Bacteroidales bacterium]